MILCFAMVSLILCTLDNQEDIIVIHIIQYKINIIRNIEIKTFIYYSTIIIIMMYYRFKDFN